MSNDVFIERTGKTAKLRNPWLVFLYGVLTLGIYPCFWWYFVNRELADLGRARGTDRLGTSPGTSTAAFVLGGFIFVPLVITVITTNRRVMRAQELTVGKTLNPWIAGLLWVLTLSIGGQIYLQYELNKVWRAPGMRQSGEPAPNRSTWAAAAASEDQAQPRASSRASLIPKWCATSWMTVTRTWCTTSASLRAPERIDCR